MPLTPVPNRPRCPNCGEVPDYEHHFWCRPKPPTWRERLAHSLTLGDSEKARRRMLPDLANAPAEEPKP